MEIDAVLFDLDGTLTNRWRTIDRFANTFASRFIDKAHGIDVLALSLRLHELHLSGRCSQAQIGACLQSSIDWRQMPRFAELVQFWDAEIPKLTVAAEGASVMLRMLRRDGVRIGMVSNGPRTKQRRKIRSAELCELTDTVVISDEVGFSKPDVRIFQIAMKQLSVIPARTVFVGDDPIADVIGSQNAGIKSIWLKSPGAVWPTELPAPGRVIASLSELYAEIDFAA